MSIGAIFATLGGIAVILFLAWLGDLAASAELRAHVRDFFWWLGELPQIWWLCRLGKRPLREFLSEAAHFWRLRAAWR